MEEWALALVQPKAKKLSEKFSPVIKTVRVMELFKKEKHFIFTLHFSSKQMDILNVNKYQNGLKNEPILLGNFKKLKVLLKN